MAHWKPTDDDERARLEETFRRLIEDLNDGLERVRALSGRITEGQKDDRG